VKSLLVLMLVAGFAAAAEPTYPTNEDLRHVRGMIEPQLSPSGTQVLVNISDTTADGGRSHLWLVDVAANASRQITWSPESDRRGEHAARWFGDSSILFLAKRGEHTQLFSLPMSGGEAHPYDMKVVPPVDDSTQADAVPPKKAGDDAAAPEPLPIEPEAYEAAPDGRTIAIIASDPETPGEKKQKDSKSDAERADHDRHGKRLYLLDVPSGKLTAVAVAPDVTAIIWSKQGDRFVVVADGPNNARDLGPATTSWLVSTGDPAHPVQLKEIPPTIGSVSWSEDGTRLYILADSARDAPPGYLDLYAMNLSDRTIQDMSKDFVASVSREKPISIGNDVIQSVQQGFRRGYIRWRNNKMEPIAFDSPVVSGLTSDAKRGAWVWLGQSSSEATTLYYSRRLGESARTLNTPGLLPASWPSAITHAVRWTQDGLTIEGELFLPVAAGAGKIPLIVDVHGGPTGAFQDNFDPLTPFLLGQGWAVLRTNPRGSTGYGAAFAAANKDDLGGGDYRDIMAGLDAVIAQYPIDANRLALTGYSYGGEMAGFVEGKTNRFKAIVSGAPVINQYSEYGTEGESWYDRWFYGKPWEHAQAAWRQSPLAGAAHASTPFMLLQGESDTVDPPGQSAEMYRALRQEGVKVELIQYPRENHGPLALGMHGFPSPEPWHGFDARQRLVKFIKEAFEAQ
jgi:dipeptidyl aminopeptidase/acylaminoacyl peptidase